jgi:hypothetical protein
VFKELGENAQTLKPTAVRYLAVAFSSYGTATWIASQTLFILVAYSTNGLQSIASDFVPLLSLRNTVKNTALLPC